MGCQIIAEIGSNHNGSWDMALDMLDRISESGADAAKFQFYRAERLYSKDTVVADYLVGKGGIRKNTRIVDLLKATEIPEEWLALLVRACRERRLALVMSVFDVDSIPVLVDAGIQTLKIASSEITHYPLLKAAGETGLPVILSTGMSSLGMIEKAVEHIGHSRITLLHCTGAYPAPQAEVNLRVIPTLRAAFGCPVGLSDHTMGLQAAALACALGATTIEKHFTLDRSLPGPDQAFAVTPEELTELVDAVRNAEVLLGSPAKTITPKEREMILYTPGLFAAQNIPENTVIQKKHIQVLRRGGFGLGIEFFEVVLGRRTATEIKKGEVLTWEKI